MTARCARPLTPHWKSNRTHVLDFDPPQILNEKKVLAPPDLVITSLVSLTATPASAVTLSNQAVVASEITFQGRKVEAGTGVSVRLGGMNGERYLLEAVVTLSNGETEVLQVDVVPTGK